MLMREQIKNNVEKLINDIKTKYPKASIHTLYEDNIQRLSLEVVLPSGIQVLVYDYCEFIK